MKRRWIIALGSNLADSEAALALGWRAVVALLPLQEPLLSPVWRTDPAEGASGGEFANAVGIGWSEAEPLDGLEILQRIENSFGRDRSKEGFHGARPLDLDVIDVSGVRLDHPRLILPHPRWQQRPFVAGPLRQVCPEFLDP
jgi:2-amino-4-hydroxy-6-hydroxymethyldihydropteridine diphosphokinase